MNKLFDPKLKYQLMCPMPSDLKIYREGNTLQKALYDFILDERYKYEDFNGDMLWALNEAFYQCARLYEDSSPEADIYNNYLFTVNPILRNGEKFVSDQGAFVFCLVYIVLSVQMSLPEGVRIFNKYLRTLLNDYSFIENADKRIQEILENGRLNTDLAPNAYPYCRFYSQDIKTITNDFDVRTIEILLRRCRTKEYQHTLLEMIETSFYHLNPKARPTSAVPPVPM